MLFSSLPCDLSSSVASPSSVCRWSPLLKEDELKAAGGRSVVKIGDQKILVQELEGEYYAVSNKCSHLGLPLQVS